MKILIKKGFIVDGTGKKGFRGDILLNDGLIKEISPCLERESEKEFDKVIDASDYIVSPGFIDTCSHSDLKVLINPFIDHKIRQGITTEIFGHDGISMSPISKKHINDWKKILSPLKGNSENIDLNYETTETYLNTLSENGILTNVGYLIPHGNLRMEVIGLSNIEPSSNELQKMKEIIRRELESGAIGLSIGLNYIPCNYAKFHELVECCRMVSYYDGVFVVHMKNEYINILESIKEIIEIGRQTGVKIHFSQLKPFVKKDTLDKFFSILEKAIKDEVRVSFDACPYVSENLMLSSLLPPWTYEEGTEKLFSNISNFDIRELITKDIINGILGWDNILKHSEFDNILISKLKTPSNQHLIGKSILEISKFLDKDPFNTIYDILIQEENSVEIINFYTKEEYLIKFLNHTEQNICTNASLTNKPQPRIYGSFPRVLGKYVREEKVLSLENAIYKMTAKPANVFGLKKKGILKAGYDSDIVIFNAQTIIDMASFEAPSQYPNGIHTVIVNGEVIIENNTLNKNLKGKIIKNSTVTNKLLNLENKNNPDFLNTKK